MSMNHQTGAPRRRRRKNFITLTSPDKGILVIIAKWEDDVTLHFSFSLQGRMPLVDAIDALPYVYITHVHHIDGGGSFLYLQITDGECFELSRLADDLRELLFSNPS